jgi:AcrR family transcriptional regulator
MNEMPDAKATTKAKILDAAEKLFGMNGFDATSLRDITAEAQVNLAAVNYHFQSKEALMEAVISRRIQPVNRRRLELLNAAGENPTVEQVIRAFLAPVFLEINLGGVPSLIGRVLADPGQFLKKLFPEEFAPLMSRFAEAFARALPELAPAEVAWRMHFMIGSMSHVLLWKRHIKEMSGGLVDMSDREAVMAEAIAYCAAGFRAPALQLTAVEKRR